MTNTTTDGRPELEVTSQTETRAGEGAPSAEIGFAAVEALAATARPELVPPGESTAAAATTAGVTAWHSGKKITSLWSNTANRNSWIGIDGIGWKKLADNSDSAVVALTMLASSAKQTASAVNVREEADGKVYEIYVF